MYSVWTHVFSVVKSPRQARNCLCYVLLNRHKHVAESGMRREAGWIDDCSSGRWFDGWRGLAPPTPDPDKPVSDPHTWILSTGWRRLGLLSLDALPGRRRSGTRRGVTVV